MFGRKKITRWQREPNAFAVRIEVEDLKGLLQRGLVVEPGTNAILVHNGRNMGLVPPGRYTLDNLRERLADWVRGLPHHATALLVDVAPTDLRFHLERRLTKDPLPVGLKLHLRVSVDDAGKFLLNVLKGHAQFTVEDLERLLYPEVDQVVSRWLRQRTLDELLDNPQALQILEMELEEALKETFRESGLKFHRVRAVELDLEPYQRLGEERGRYALLLQEEEIHAAGEAALAEARLKARARKAEIQKQIDLQELAEETHKVERQERLMQLYQRMRQALLNDKMHEIRTQAEFERFLDQMDREKLLREKERQDLLRAWEEEAEDHERARRFMLEKLEAERRYQLELMRLQQQQDLDQRRWEAEVARRRQRLELELEERRKLVRAELENERERLRLAEERKRAQLELERLQRQMEREGDLADAMMGLEILAKLKEIKRLDEEERRRIAREDELARQRAALEMEVRRWELRLREKAMDQQHELARMEYLAQLGVEALITLSGPEQARLLADLKKTEALKGMSEEQILALAADKSPEVARAFQERYRAIVEGQASERERAMYERLLAEKDATRQEMSEALRQSHQDALQAVQGLANKSVDAMRDIGVAQAQRPSDQPPIIITGSSASTTEGTTPAQRIQPPQGKKVCPQCGRFVDEDWRYCSYCGHEFTV